MQHYVATARSNIEFKRGRDIIYYKICERFAQIFLRRTHVILKSVEHQQKQDAFISTIVKTHIEIIITKKY
ncbi:hypothetical protein A6J42_20820 [Leptospira interrogans serovar Copenhageni]|nr:hypothetical protein A6J42_20820 [Leptospira interrogans serovar Copenhageni]